MCLPPSSPHLNGHQPRNYEGPVHPISEILRLPFRARFRLATHSLTTPTFLQAHAGMACPRARSRNDLE